MTVIATLITKYGTVHASDSRRMSTNDRRIVGNDEETKIVPVPKFRGALSFYGLAEYRNFKTLDWLRNQVSQSKHSSPEEFAIHIKDGLKTKFSNLRFTNPMDQGIGIHFSAYERINDYWIPELFHISNFSNPNYSSLKTDGITASRETFGTMKKQASQLLPSPGNNDQRLEVHKFLHNDGMLIYNNGDPILFNSIANSIMDSFRELRKRNALKNLEDERLQCDMVRRPVEIVSRILTDFAKEEFRLVGGRSHDYLIHQDGRIFSTTRDA